MYTVDIETALSAIALEPECVLFNLNSNDELTPSVLGINLKSQRCSEALPLNFKISWLFFVTLCL